MKILGAVLMVVGAFWCQVWWMAVVFAAGLILFALGIERSILEELQLVKAKLRDEAIRAAIQEYQAEQLQSTSDDKGNVNKQLGSEN